MNKKIFLSTLLITGAVTLAACQSTFAADTADQTLSASLGPLRSVITNGGNLGATISETTGALSAALTPGFTLQTNTGNTQTVALTADSNISGGTEKALFGTGATGSTFILLTNNTALPSLGAVTDAKSGAPTPAANPNVIAYPVNKPDDIASELAYTWNSDEWRGSLTHKGDTNTLLTIPADTPRTNTFSIEDLDGSYQSTITLSYVTVN